MRIECQAPEGAGGIWPLLFVAPYTLENIAPERFEELVPRIAGATLYLDDSPRFRAAARASSKEMWMTRGLAEATWCVSFAYYSFRTALEAGGLRGGVSLDPATNPQIRTALAVLREGVSAAADDRYVNWDGLPTPVPPSQISPDSSLEAKAGEMALCALGFVLQHELAHVTLGHVPSGDAEWTLEQEKDADDFAVRWILSSAPTTTDAEARAVGKRGWGIVIATALLTARRLQRLRQGIAPAPVEEQSHPQPYDRLDRAVQHESVRESALLTETLKSLACAALVPHIRLESLPLRDGPYEDYAELYQTCLDLLADQFVM